MEYSSQRTAAVAAIRLPDLRNSNPNTPATTAANHGYRMKTLKRNDIALSIFIRCLTFFYRLYLLPNDLLQLNWEMKMWPVRRSVTKLESATDSGLLPDVAKS